MKQIMIAAAGSGSGKTLITCALLQALKNRGLKPHAFKCGPDYIDPMFHRAVLNVPSNNLDLFFVEDDKLRRIYAENVQDSDVAVVEGVMGLYDGIYAASDEGSAYHIASVLDLPVMLVIDAHGMGRSILPLIKGFLEYDGEKRIDGFFLNRISENFYKKVAPLIESDFGIPVVGFLPNNPGYAFESRHLGLKLPGELPMLKEQIENAADTLEQNGTVDKIMEVLSNTAISCGRCAYFDAYSKNANVKINDEHILKIGVARDETFCFYYEENLKMLKEYGAELVFFSPLHDEELPGGLDAVVLGGGYPELYAGKLSENKLMRSSIKKVITGGMPSIAECGGFMYLHDNLRDADGDEYAMCGVIPGSCYNTGRLVRFGYVNIAEKHINFLKKNDFIKGHEFHYYDSDSNGNDCIAKKPVSQAKWDCIYNVDDHFWGFPHLYYPSNPDFVVKFIEKARNFYEQKNSRYEKLI